MKKTFLTRAIVLMTAITPLSASIVFTDLADHPVFEGEPSPTVFYLDLNSNGVADLAFRAFDSYFDVVTVGSIQIAGFQAPPPIGVDPGSEAAEPPFDLIPFAFEPGFVLDETLDGIMTWNSGRGLLQAPVMNGNEEFTLGYWGDGVNYLGVRLLEDDGWHYGWVEIDAPFRGINGGYMNGMAYETSANRAIVAGAIPEPATAGILFGVVALGGVVCRRRCRLLGSR